MKVIVDCPLGSKCESMVDGDTMKRCAWYVEIAGVHPQTGQHIDEWKCAMAWMPLLTVENAMTNRGQTAAIESLRNEQVLGQNTFNEILLKATQTRNLIGEY